MSILLPIENRRVNNRRFLRPHVRYPEILGNRLHPVLSIEGEFMSMAVGRGTDMPEMDENDRTWPETKKSCTERTERSRFHLYIRLNKNKKNK